MNRQNNDNIKATSDWLASNPVFYNEKTNVFSENINDVIDFKNLEFDPEGLAAYLDFGYSVFGQTPVKNLKFLLPNSQLELIDNKISISQNNDDAINLLHQNTNEDDVIDLLKDKVQQWEKSLNDDIIIPLSGGFDSRILTTFINDKTRIHAFTYGLDNNKNKSRDIVYAKKLSEIYDIDWSPVKLGYFHNYIPQCYNMFGVSANLTANYHFEFFDKIQALHPCKMNLLSGIIGDAWAGAFSVPPVNSINDLKILGHTHGINADVSQLLFSSKKELYDEYFEREKNNLNDPLYRIIASMRYKLIFLCLLYRIPKHYGYQAWSPFLDKDVAIAMLNLPADRRLNRMWQRDYFKKIGTNVEDMNLPYSRTNSLNNMAIKLVPLKPLNPDILKEIIKPDYINWINKQLTSNSIVKGFYNKLMYTPLIKGGLQLMGCKNRYMEAYNAYQTIKPLEQLLVSRNENNE